MSESRPVGPPVPGFAPRPLPARAPVEGTWCRAVPLEPAHADALFAAFRGGDQVWDYLLDGPYHDPEAFRANIAAKAVSTDPLFFAVIDRADGAPKGYASLMRITPEHGVIELGNINWSPLMQRSRFGTEALLRLMAYAFGLGYRRFEWKCNALNAPSRRLAMRLGLSFEGVFRAHLVAKGRNRDSAWYAATEYDWPALKAAHEAWLDPANFDSEGRQKRSLTDLTKPLLLAVG